MPTQIHCVVIRVPAEIEKTPGRSRRHDALPWADPYILGLIAKLQREVKTERAAKFRQLREEGSSLLVPQPAVFAGQAPPPLTTATGSHFADDDDGFADPLPAHRFNRQPR